MEERAVKQELFSESYYQKKNLSPAAVGGGSFRSDMLNQAVRPVPHVEARHASATIPGNVDRGGKGVDYHCR